MKTAKNFQLSLSELIFVNFGLALVLYINVLQRPCTEWNEAELRFEGVSVSEFTQGWPISYHNHFDFGENQRDYWEYFAIVFDSAIALLIELTSLLVLQHIKSFIWDPSRVRRI